MPEMSLTPPPEITQTPPMELTEFLADTETDLLLSQIETTTTNEGNVTVQQRHMHQQKKSSPTIPVFHNCHIGNMTINIVKK